MQQLRREMAIAAESVPRQEATQELGSLHTERRYGHALSISADSAGFVYRRRAIRRHE